MVKEKKFREDLYYRLNTITITVPPLRDRSEDIPLLLDFFIEQIADENNDNKPTLTPAAINFLKKFQWKGNVRQLRSFVRRMLIFKTGDMIDLGTVKMLLTEPAANSESEDHEPKSLAEVRKIAERKHILSVLEEFDYKVAKAAEILDVDRANLYRKMKGLGISW